MSILSFIYIYVVTNTRIKMMRCEILFEMQPRLSFPKGYRNYGRINIDYSTYDLQ